MGQIQILNNPGRQEDPDIESKLRMVQAIQQIAGAFGKQKQMQDAQKAKDLSEANDFQRKLRLEQAINGGNAFKFGAITPEKKGYLGNVERPASVGAIPVEMTASGDATPAEKAANFVPLDQGTLINPAVYRAEQNAKKEAALADTIKALRLKGDLENEQLGNKPMIMNEGDTVATPNQVKSGEVTIPKKGMVQKPLDFKDVGDAIVGLDPLTGKEVSRTAKVQGMETKETPRGLFVYDPKDPSKGSIAPGTEPIEKTTAIPKMNDADTEVVKTLSVKNANKISIANQLEQGFKTLTDSTVSTAEKVKEGQRLLKVLNSSEGQDAVGSDEAKRLGSLLESGFHPTGIYDPAQPMFGRDISGFANQLNTGVKSIRNSVKGNETVINKIQGKYGIQPGESMIQSEKTNGKPDLSKFEGAPHFTNEEAAHAAGLKDGTPIIINGRPAFYHP